MKICHEYITSLNNSVTKKYTGFFQLGCFKMGGGGVAPTFCLCEGCSKSANGELSGSSKASRANVLSSSGNTSALSSPLSAK